MIDEERLLAKVNNIMAEGDCPSLLKAMILSTLTLAILELKDEDNKEGSQA